MRIYLKGTHRAALRMFRHGDHSDIDRITAENDAAIATVFDGLMDGRYEYAFIRDGENVHLYTKSARIDGVQRTTFWDRNGEWVPLSDQQYHNVKDWKRDGYPSRRYMNVKVA